MHLSSYCVYCGIYGHSNSDLCRELLLFAINEQIHIYNEKVKKLQLLASKYSQ